MAQSPYKITIKNGFDIRKLRYNTDKEKKALQAYRTRAQDILSDFISENIKGFGKPLDAQFKKGFSNTDSAGKNAAPDIQLSVQEFNALVQGTGLQVKQTGLFKSQALQTEDVAFAELKSSLEGSGLETSSAAAIKTDEGYAALEEKLAKKLIAQRGSEISDLLWGSEFTQTREKLIKNVGNKIENLVVVQIGDAAKKNRATTVKFFPSMDKIQKAGTSQADWNKVYTTRARIKKGKGIFFSAEVNDSFKE